MVKHLKTLSTLSYVVAGASILWFFYSVCNGVFGAMLLADPNLWHDWTGQYSPQDEIQVNAISSIISGVCFSIGSIAGAAVNFMAAGKYRRGEGRTFLLVASILNVIPCLASCCLVGIPVGIYGLVVLNNAEVKKFFDTQDPAERAKLAEGPAAGDEEDAG